MIKGLTPWDSYSLKILLFSCDSSGHQSPAHDSAEQRIVTWAAVCLPPPENPYLGSSSSQVEQVGED